MGDGPWTWSFDLRGSNPQIDIGGGGSVREASASTFPALQGLAVFYLTMEPGSVRIPHWHDANEVQYLLRGRIRVGMTTPAQGTGPGAEIHYELTPGMIGFVPMGWFHYIENPGDETAEMLIIFNTETPDNFDVSWCLRLMPPAMQRQVLGTDQIDTRQIWISPPAHHPRTEPGARPAGQTEDHGGD
jgi:oxalate decarboxylase